jgi:hypothetical protein
MGDDLLLYVCVSTLTADANMLRCAQTVFELACVLARVQCSLGLCVDVVQCPLFGSAHSHAVQLLPLLT